MPHISLTFPNFGSANSAGLLDSLCIGRSALCGEGRDGRCLQHHHLHRSYTYKARTFGQLGICELQAGQYAPLIWKWPWKTDHICLLSFKPDNRTFDGRNPNPEQHLQTHTANNTNTLTWATKGKY